MDEKKTTRQEIFHGNDYTVQRKGQRAVAEKVPYGEQLLGRYFDGYPEVIKGEETLPTYKVKLEKDVKVPMRDGIHLYTDIYRPDVEGEKFPALLAYAGLLLLSGLLLGDPEEVFPGLVRIVLTDPDSHAAGDAARYKMRPRTLMEDCPLDQIIGRNIHTLRDLVWRYPECDLGCFLTDVALPCAYLKAEFDDPDRDNLKVDLYLPSFTEYGPAVEVRPGRREQTVLDESQCDNRLRQSFLIFRKEQPELYQTFSDNMEQILAHSRELKL